jgi:hypothetical protein
MVLASGAVEQHRLYVLGQDHSFGRCGVCTKQLVPAQTGTCTGTKAACRHCDCMGIAANPTAAAPLIMIYRK